MDPNLFHLDWDRSFEVLATIVLLSLLVERALAPFFESRRLLAFFDQPGVKEFTALVVSAGVCIDRDFDAISMIVLKETTTVPGKIITGAVVAGGSKGSIKLFRDWLGFHSTAWKEHQESKKSGGGGSQTPTPKSTPKDDDDQKEGGGDA